jgi:hypothetical protein
VLSLLRWPMLQQDKSPAGEKPRTGGRGWLLALWLLAVAWSPGTAGQSLELVQLALLNTEQGLMIDFDSRFELPASVEEALQKGVALHFAAEARLFERRWYWRDRRVAQARRSWRIAYQPLTFSYRVNFGGLGQTYPTLAEALRTVQRSTNWRVADPLAPGDRGQYYVEFSYRLDRDQLPRPLQIGVSSTPEWDLQVERTVPVPSP